MTPYATGSQGSTKVSFVVDNVRFLVDTDLVLAHPETMLGRMLASHHFTESAPSPPHRTGGHQDHDRDSSPPSRDENSSSTNQSSVSSSHHHCRDIVLSADTPSGACISANLFRVIMQFYTEGYITCPPGLSVAELKHACDYFLIPFNQNTIRCYNIRLLLHELANEGARAVFDNFLETHLLELLVDRTRFGERECHIVVVQDDEVIVWDREHPPQMPENELPSHIVYNTSIFRFLKYNENREVAKQVLSERGLKKIRIGIESYPTSKDRLKFRPGMTRPEAIYNYVQSPFLRLSWEEEEAKSRHVDFQCVRSKSVSDLTSGLEQAVVDPLPPHLQPFRRPESPPPSGEPGPQQMPRQLPSSILPSPPLTVDASTTRPNDSSESSPLARPGDQG